MSLPVIPCHQLCALRRKAVSATAALAHWRHDFTGRAARLAANDSPAGRIAVPSPAATSLPVGGAFHPVAHVTNPSAEARHDHVW